MSTATTPVPSPAPPAKKKKKKKAPSWFGTKFDKACRWFTCIVVGFLILNGLFGGGGKSQPEAFNPNKMSQVPRQWPAPAWASLQEDGRPSRAFNPLRNLELKLQRGLESIPQDTADREWRYKSWHGPIPERREPPPFQFYSPDCERR